MRIDTLQAGASLFLLLFGVLVCVESSQAQSSQTVNGQTIGLNEAVSRTMLRNPELIAFGHQFQAQEGRVLQAGQAPNLELDFTIENALGSGDFSGTDRAEATLSIAWILERGVRQRRLDTARAGVSLVSVEADIMRLDAAAETARLLFACLSNQARKLSANEAVQLAQDTVQAVQKRVKAGKSPQAELARAQAELARMKLNQGDIRHALLATYHRLAAQWGETRPEFTQVSGDLLRLPNPESFDTLKTRIDQNPEFARFLSKQRVGEAQLRLARAQRKPGWRVSAGIRRLEASNDEALVANITLPLTQRSWNQGNIAEAQANLAQTSADASAARVRIETLLFVFYQELQRSLHRAKTFRDDVIPRLEQALTETRSAYELGRYSYLEWRIVQEDLLAARNALIEASADVHQKIIEIERLTGVRLAQSATSP